MVADRDTWVAHHRTPQVLVYTSISNTWINLHLLEMNSFDEIIIETGKQLNAVVVQDRERRENDLLGKFTFICWVPISIYYIIIITRILK